jgi:hypothetical protein
MSVPTFTVRDLSGLWHLIVVQNWLEDRYPARSKVEAEIMMRFEKRRRGVPVK